MTISIPRSTRTRRSGLAQGAELARSRPVDYGQAVEPFLETYPLSHSERAMLMGGANGKAWLVAEES